MAVPPNGIPCKKCGNKLHDGDLSVFHTIDVCPHCGYVYRETKKENMDLYTIIIIRNLDNDSHKLTSEQINLLRNSINNTIPDSPDGLMVKLAFADALIDAMNQKGPNQNKE